jgi:hypothetical protein
MPMLSPSGLFQGQRLGACSDRVQDRWHRYYCAADSFGRIEGDFDAVRHRCFMLYKQPPPVDEIVADFKELVANFLLIPYHAAGRLWFQFATDPRFLPPYKTVADKQKPEPSEATLTAFEEGYAKWRKDREQSFEKSADLLALFSDYSQNIPTTVSDNSAEIPRRVSEDFAEVSSSKKLEKEKEEEDEDRGIGVGIGVGDDDDTRVRARRNKSSSSATNMMSEAGAAADGIPASTISFLKSLKPSSSSGLLPKTKKQKQPQPQKHDLARAKRAMQIAPAVSTPPRKAAERKPA